MMIFVYITFPIVAVISILANLFPESLRNIIFATDKLAKLSYNFVEKIIRSSVAEGLMMSAILDLLELLKKVISLFYIRR